MAIAYESISQRFCNSGGYRGRGDNNSAQQRDRGSSREAFRSNLPENNYSQNNIDDEWDVATSAFQKQTQNFGNGDWEEKYQPSANAYVLSSSSFGNQPQSRNANSYQSGGDSRSYSNDKRTNYSKTVYNSDNNRSYGSYDNPSDEKVEVKQEYEPIDWDKANAQADAARKARWEKCPLMVKDFYVEHSEVTEMTEETVEHFRKENKNIVVSRTFAKEESTESMPKPTTKFEHAFEKFPDLMAEITKAGFEKPSPIQSQMWPILLRGEDCIGIAQTGTGKTLAFLLPALIHTDGQPHPRGVQARGGPNVLVLAPTRELAIQIEKEVGKYQFRGIKAVCLYGGNDRNKQIEVVESGVEIIIATPGRLNDLVAAGHIKIESVTYLILDEADRMLDMGFEPQIRKLLLDIRDDRQTVMTSATWPAGVRRLASSYMNNPYQVFIGSLDLAATHTVEQRIEIMEEEEKFNRIMRFCLNEMTPTDKAIIFCGRKDRADSLSCDFALKNISCQAIHGNREQSDREQALADIKSGEVSILIATDVASRGIDIEGKINLIFSRKNNLRIVDFSPDITYVVNYDFPRNIEEYVHRVGRTGRANRRGTSLSFMTRSDWGSAAELIEILKEAEQEISQELVDMAERFKAKKERENSERGSFRGSFRGSRGNRGNNSRGGGGGGGGRNRW